MRTLVVLAVLAAGGYLLVHHLEAPDRSVQAVCQVWDTQGAALHDQFENSGKNASADPLAALGNLATAPSQIGSLMQNMANVAPGDVEPAFNALAQAFSQVQSNEGSALSDPLSALGSDLVEGFSTQGAVDEVDQFLSRNCGIPT